MTEPHDARVVDLDEWRDGYQQEIGYAAPPEGWTVISVHPRDCPTDALIRLGRGQWHPISHVVEHDDCWRVWVDHGDHLTSVIVEPHKRRDTTFLTVAYRAVMPVPQDRLPTNSDKGSATEAMRWHPSAMVPQP